MDTREHLVLRPNSAEEDAYEWNELTVSHTRAHTHIVVDVMDPWSDSLGPAVKPDQNWPFDLHLSSQNGKYLHWACGGCQQQNLKKKR